jgi:hypothetical protein
MALRKCGDTSEAKNQQIFMHVNLKVQKKKIQASHPSSARVIGHCLASAEKWLGPIGFAIGIFRG